MQSHTPNSKDRQMQFVETPIQRHERIAFIRRREWARRVSAWIDNSNSVSDDYRRDVLYDSAMVHRSLLQVHSWSILWHSSQNTQPTPPKSTSWDIPLPKYDDDEPYIIYSSSGNSSTSSPSSSNSALSDDSSSPSTSPMRPHPPPYPMAKAPRRKRSSLSSINEEPEET